MRKSHSTKRDSVALPASDFVRIDGVSKNFTEGGRTRFVLRDADAQFGKGEFVAILGKSGTGKSTLLNLISGIDRVDKGEIWVNSVNLTALSEHELTLFRRRNIGFIFQFFNLIPTLTVFENVILPAQLNNLDSNEARDRAVSLLNTVGLNDRSETFPDRLSGGEQQRVAIARALVHDPMLVLADEPTGNLDEESGLQVLTLLDQLTRQAGKNLVLVTHSQESAAFADRSLFLRDGKLSAKNLATS